MVVFEVSSKCLAPDEIGISQNSIQKLNKGHWFSSWWFLLSSNSPKTFSFLLPFSPKQHTPLGETLFSLELKWLHVMLTPPDISSSGGMAPWKPRGCISCSSSGNSKIPAVQNVGSTHFSWLTQAILLFILLFCIGRICHTWCFLELPCTAYSCAPLFPVLGCRPTPTIHRWARIWCSPGTTQTASCCGTSANWDTYTRCDTSCHMVSRTPRVSSHLLLRVLVGQVLLDLPRVCLLFFLHQEGARRRGREIPQRGTPQRGARRRGREIPQRGTPHRGARRRGREIPQRGTPQRGARRRGREIPQRGTPQRGARRTEERSRKGWRLGSSGFSDGSPTSHQEDRGDLEDGDRIRLEAEGRRVHCDPDSHRPRILRPVSWLVW